VTDDPLILVVDDEDSGRFVKVQTLRRAGLRVREAGTGREALTMVAAEHPDLVLLDVNLPDISGYEVCRRLRANFSGDGPPLQILHVSNTAVGAADQVRGLDEGADGYLTEPVDGSVLVATVQALLRVRRAEAALSAAVERERQARQAAEDLSRMKDEFIATLSHELRTPLNALMGWIWQLRHSTLNEAARTRALDSLERNAALQAQLINDLLDVSRSSKGKLRLELRMVDLRSVIADAVESVREGAGGKQLNVQVTATPAVVVADAARLQQVVTNLLTNAVQFTPEGGTIDVSLTAEGDKAVIRVRDTGAGIDPSFLPHVFDQFRQGEGVLSRKHGGLGLGLAVVHQLVELHGGSVTVTSGGAGLGASFTVTLPKEDVAFDAQGKASGLVLSGVSVLLVEAEPSARDGHCAILESAGARITLPDSAGEAARLLETRDFDVVVCGSGMTARQRDTLIDTAHHASGEVPAVVVSGVESVRNDAAATVPPDATLVEPFAPSDLVRAVVHLLRRHSAAGPSPSLGI
jgi:signal transduction histidine kinase